MQADPEPASEPVNYSKFNGGKPLMANFDQELDVTGERCPVPVFKTQKALNQLNSGEILHVITDDPVSMQNMASFVEINSQYELLESKQEGTAFFYLIKKS